MRFINILSLILITFCLQCIAQNEDLTHSNQLVEKAKLFVHRLSQEEFSNLQNDFDQTMKEALPIDKLINVWQSLKQQVGAFKQQGKAKIERAGEFNIVYVTCEFENSTLDAKIVYNKSSQVSGLFFVPTQIEHVFKPPSYVNPKSFTEQEATIISGEWKLPGTISIPRGSGPYPALVLVHGSGPQDRDESIGPNKPFADLAWGLASKGIAVLRYEKRTKQYGKQLANTPITVMEETIEDALSAVALLKKTNRINPSKIFILGHSLGGMLIPRIGLLDNSIAGFVLLAASCRNLEDMIIEQMNYIFSLDGEISPLEKSQLDNIQQQAALVKSGLLSIETPSSELPLGIPASYWLDLREYNPTKTIQQIIKPLLILQGGRDYQVTIEDFNGWKNALSGRKNIVFKLYPKLNHLFIEGEGKSTPNEYDIEGHVAEEVINDIAQWILSQR